MPARRKLGRFVALATAVAWMAVVGAGRAAADRRYFLESYTPYLAPAGESEVETWLTAKSGKQDPDESASWEPRLEYELAVTGRFTASAYLNFIRPPGAALHFDSPSVELIYQLARPGRLPIDTALYLETSEWGGETELEPKLLLARRFGRLIPALNLIGDFEYRHNNEELLPDGDVLRREFEGEVSGGLAWELVPKVAFALETRYRAEYPNFGRRADSVFSLGPSVNLQYRNAQLAVGVLPQLAGTPRTKGNRNLVDFEKTQVRAVLGLDL